MGHSNQQWGLKRKQKWNPPFEEQRKNMKEYPHLRPTKSKEEETGSLILEDQYGNLESFARSYGLVAESL